MMNTKNTKNSIRSVSFVMLALLQLPADAQESSWFGAGSMPSAAAVQELLLAAPQESKSHGGSSLRGAANDASQWTPASSVEGQQVMSPQAEREFLSEVETALGAKLAESSQDRLGSITEALRPTFEAVEKNEYGKLGHTAVRYVLHRLFVARHGWFMKGLDPAGQHFNTSSPVQVLQGKASLRVQGIFEKRLGGQGFGLQEVTVLASVLETMISQEAGERLRALYEKFDLELNTTVVEEIADHIVDIYLSAFLLGRDMFTASVGDLMDDVGQIPDLYAFWGEAQKLARATREELLGSREDYTFQDIRAVLTLIGERFGKWQHAECQQMKERLVKLEDGEEGCVPLSSFWKGTLTSGGSDWQFGESLDYLNTNGIVDKSDPRNVKVMIANYMNNPGNCIASSRYYSVCCIDECEALVGHIELNVRAGAATPEKLLSLVASLPSSSVPANRTLPPTQTRRLYKIAEIHGGQVPIHGRLFMQWMHMIYPRECAYPHMSGTTKPLTADEWENATKKNSSATDDEMKAFVHAPAASQGSDQGQCGRWVDEEELFVGTPTTSRRNLHELENDMQTWVATSSVALLCLLAVTMVAVIHTFKSMKHALCSGWKWNQPLVLV